MPHAASGKDAVTSGWRHLDAMIVCGGLAVVSLALGSVLLRWCWQHSPLIVADPAAYVAFARSLAQGQFFIQSPVAEAVAAFSSGELEVVGPEWNTSIVPGGRLAYTIAIGYPLWLAVMLRVGGMWLVVYSNVLLIGVVLACFGLCVWGGLRSTRRDAAIATTAVLFFFMSSHETLLQFTRLWREPLTYFCMLTSIGALIAFERGGGRARWVVLAALAAGYAVTVKEANALYAVPLGLAALTLPAFRQCPFKLRLIGLAVLAVGIGVSPLLIQNMWTTGNPLVSLQTLRETSQFSLTDAGAGLSAGNTGETLRRYVGLYRSNLYVGWPGLLLCLAGLAMMWRTVAARLFLGVLLIHLAVYLQWGNAEYRHMLLAHLPYAVFVAHALVQAGEMPGRYLRRAERLIPYLRWIPALILAALAIRLAPVRGRADALGTVQDFADSIESMVPAQGVLLVNRQVSDLSKAFTDRHVIRLRDLARVSPEGDPLAVVDWLLDRGHQLLFLDSLDGDPKNVGRVNWQAKDQAELMSRFDLVPIHTIETHAPVRMLAGKDALTLYEIQQWQSAMTRDRFVFPAGGAAFLDCCPRSLLDRMVVRVEGEPCVWSGTRFWLVPPIAPDAPAPEVTVTAGGALVPGQLDARFVDWRETITIDVGSDALPADIGFFPDGPGDQEDRSNRRFDTATRIRVPVREGPDLFTALRLQVWPYDPDTLERTELTFVLPDGQRRPIALRNMQASNLLLPLDDRPVERQRMWSGLRDITIEPPSAGFFRINWLQSKIVSTRMTLDAPFGTQALGLITGVVPYTNTGDEDAWPIAIRIDGRHAAACTLKADHWTRQTNQLRFFYDCPEPVSGPLVLAVDGGGLSNLDWAALTSRLVLRPDAIERVFLEGFHDHEQDGDDCFAWSRHRASVRVARTAGASGYRLELDLMDGRPRTSAGRMLTIRFEGVERQIELPRRRTTVAVELPRPDGVPEQGVSRVMLSAPLWSPAQVVGSADHRELGFRLYGLRWVPVE